MLFSMPKLDKKPLLNQNIFCDKCKIRLKKPMLNDARRDFFTIFSANVNQSDSKFILVWCLLSECHCLQATIPWSKSMIFMFATSNITKLFNSLSKRQVSANLLPDLFRKRFCMAWRLVFLMFYSFLNIFFIYPFLCFLYLLRTLTPFLTILSRKITTQAETS